MARVSFLSGTRPTGRHVCRPLWTAPAQTVPVRCHTADDPASAPAAGTLPGPRWRAAGQCQKACAHWNLLCHNQGHEVWGGGGGLVARGDQHIGTPDMPAAAGAGQRQLRGAIAPRRRGVVARDQAAGQAGGESGTGQRTLAVQVRTPRWADTLRPQAARRAMRMAGSPFATCAGSAESCAFSAATSSFTLVATTALDRALTSTRDTIGQSFSPETLLPSYCRSLLTYHSPPEDPALAGWG